MTATVFQPPYLRYEDPGDLAKINARITTLRRQAKLTRPQQVSASGATLVANAHQTGGGGSIVSPTKPGSVKPKPGLTAKPVGVQDSAATSATSAVGGRGGASVQQPGSGRGASSPLSVTPSGIVPLGFNCRKRFEAWLPASMDPTHFGWNLLMKNQQTGEFDQIFFMGGTSAEQTTAPPLIQFDHDFSTYRNSAYSSSNQTAVFVVRCQPYVFFDALGYIDSDPITLDFKVQSCLGIESVKLSRDSVVGAKNDTEPVLTVTLTGPAGPGGQKVELSTDNDNLGWIMGSGFFMIEQGETQGSQSWFLGTKRVRVTGRSFNIITKLASPEGQSAAVYSNMKLTKQNP